MACLFGAFALAPTLAQAAAPPAAAPPAAGPHSPVDRSLAPTKIDRVPGAVIRNVDLGDLDLGDLDVGATPGEFRAPVRGVLITPDRAPGTPSRLLVFAHLRYPNCTDDTFAFPCPRGKERRFDEGMTYLGVALARRGFSVLIPDLAPLYIGGDLDSPYDQRAGFLKTVQILTDTALAASAGKTTRFGPPLDVDLDTSRVGLLVHSRSAYLVNDLAAAWDGTVSPIASVLAYGGAYDVAYHGGSDTSPMVPDVPYLGVSGSEDNDTPYAGALWLSQHIAAPRLAPALGAVVPGLGHTFINRTLSAARIDDRICGPRCPGAAAHERFLTNTAINWFTATLRGRRTQIPLAATDVLSRRLGGRAVQWLAASNGRRTTAFLGGGVGRFMTFGVGARARGCYPYEPMAPSRPGQCPIPAMGVSQNAARIAQIRVTPHAGVVLRTPPARDVVAVALQLAPSEDRTDDRRGSALRVEVRLRGGRSVVRRVRATDPAVLDRATRWVNGTYSIGTVRLPLPEWASRRQVQSVRVTGVGGVSRLDVRAVDLLQR